MMLSESQGGYMFYDEDKRSSIVFDLVLDQIWNTQLEIAHLRNIAGQGRYVFSRIVSLYIFILRYVKVSGNMLGN